MNFDGSAAITHYSTCSTAAATAAKVVALTGFTLVTGARIAVKFTVTNTAASPTLNVNSTGAKAIYYRGAAITAGYLAANRTYEFIYNGTQYELVGDVDTNTTYTPANAAPLAAGTAAVGTSVKFAREDYVHPAQTSVTGNAGTATKLATARKIGDANFDGAADITLAQMGVDAAIAEAIANIGPGSGSGGIPSGVIVMWSGAAAAIPSGWALCNGENGTPDLCDRFVLGAGGNYTVGQTGGEEEHALSILELASHEHILRKH